MRYDYEPTRSSISVVSVSLHNDTDSRHLITSLCLVSSPQCTQEGDQASIDGDRSPKCLSPSLASSCRWVSLGQFGLHHPSNGGVQKHSSALAQRRKVSSTF